MIYYPLYYKDFKCIADKCPDNCCKDWEIVIDKETYDYYQKLTGVTADKIRNEISVDSDGDYYFELRDGKCPFLNPDGFCDIHIAYGENATCITCRDHPRFTEEYDGFTEISLSLSCPEAARIILTQEPDNDLYPTPEYCGDDEELRLLIDSRSRVLAAKNGLYSLFVELALNVFQNEAEINLRYFGLDILPATDEIIRYIAQIEFNCEILYPYWEKLLENTLDCEFDMSEFSGFLNKNEKEMQNAFKYYVYRYYLKSICDLDIYSRARFIYFSVIAPAYIAFANKITYCEAARLYSKEIEHSTENIDILLKLIGDN